MTPPEYLVIGDLTRDLLPDGTSTLGGTTLYAAATVARLGARAAILCAADALHPPTLPAGVEIALIPSVSQSTFQNSYTSQGRLQILHARGPHLQFADLPLAWRAAPVVHLGPLTDELDLDLAAAFPNTLVGVTPQGWMRAWDVPLPAPVRRKLWRPTSAQLVHVDLIVLSIEDVGGDEALAAIYAQVCPCVAVTRGSAGATLYLN
ncbi:MAG: ribokinase, partial [Oscillochloris sp.]|nr:ribokinase [Oscillochloris sp.]